MQTNRQRSPKIYDCFCYCNEDMLLKLRLETLWDYVDYFVICEATYTQSGQAKSLNFDIEQFSKYRSKIRYLIVDHFPDGPLDFWKNESYQRNYLINGLFDAVADDWVLISDLDEIPRPEAIKEYQPKYYKGDFTQCIYNYYLNNLLCSNNREPILWYGSKITTYHHLTHFFKTATNVRSYRASGFFRNIKRVILKKIRSQTIQNGGWHFTWVLSIEKIIYKFEAAAHQENNIAKNKDPAYIRAKIENGEDLFNPDNIHIPQLIAFPNFPQYLVDHQNTEFKEWILPIKTNTAITHKS